MWILPESDVVDRVRAAADPVIVAGAGVIAGGTVPGVHALATALQAGVVNWWDAKGVFDWRSRHHLATAGLQRDDFTLAGIDAADLVITTGLAEPFGEGGDRVLDVAPDVLGPLAELVHRPFREIDVPPLRAGLAAATEAAWERTGTPLAPPVATRALSAALGTTARLAVAPGTAGFWVARTFPTQALGTVTVTADPIAARPAIAIVTEQPAELPDFPIAIEVWHPDGERLDAAAYEARLAELLHVRQTTVVSLAIDESVLAEYVAVAGPITAWPDLTFPRQ